MRIPMERDVQSIPNPWDAVRVPHAALPGFDANEVDLGTQFAGRSLAAPIQITGMTGGAPLARDVNDRLAAAAAKHGVAMGVGSQRAALEEPALSDTYSVILQHDVPARFANLGLPQILLWGEDAAARAEAAIEMIDGHGIWVHLNYLQEVVQPEGDTNARGGLEAIARLVRELQLPVMVKETGAGIDAGTIRALADAGVAAVDVGGLGGTSFSAVEYHRAVDQGDVAKAHLGEIYWDWGIPTPDCIRDGRAVCPDLALVATGGLRHGLDALRALWLGADIAGFAGTMFRAAMTSQEATDAAMAQIVDGLRTGMFLAGHQNVASLRTGF